jgi:hypothetical protein
MRMHAPGLVIWLAGMIAQPAVAGSWKYELDERDHSILSYSEDGKATFLIGCGRAFALHAKYPGKAKTEGNTRLVIASGKRSMAFLGDFEAPFDDLATTFVQFDLGYRRADLALYGKKWRALRNRLLDLLDSGKALKISAGRDSYTLPPVDAIGWREAFGKCG